MIFSLLASAALALQTAPDPALPTTDALGAERELLWHDEFNGENWDRDKWIAIGPDFWVNNELQAYIDDEATIRIEQNVEGAEGGVLVLQPHWVEEGFTTPSGRETNFVSGRLESKGKFDFTYGRAEARLRMTDHVGIWPAWWLLGNGQWPDTGEIDIMEYVGEKDWTAVAIHGPGHYGDKAPVNRHYFDLDTDVTDWHVYAVEWTAEEMIFYVDDHVVFRADRRTVGWIGEWRYDNPKHLILNFAVGGVYPAKVNMIEEPFYGLPQETADVIKEAGTGMLVDWVRVWKPVEEQPEPTNDY